ncbi:hypothetical protein FIU86_20145 [Roseovarius sp. THAF9]|uniref:hypothetical protein n=1 Tax=Roseovarius sp. THAF9 TaxID=2587847 RepID=UPI0012688CA8|nr:hypothetical protein [Roseovarius sp. THAF9]QFT95172.1 hypothetical protein FIU86_20145 [Roseovarius sp. THAF9]
MKKLTTLIAASAVVAASVAPAVAEETATTNDPFVSTQSLETMQIGGVTYVVVGVVAAGLIVALADGSSTTTSLVTN